MTKALGRFCAAAVLVLSSGLPAAAWGPLGHRAIARIAEERVSPSTKQKLEQLLGAPDALERLASCADVILHASSSTVNCGGLITVPADTAKATGKWHFINLPEASGVSVSDLPRYCPNGKDCVWAQVNEQVRAIQAAADPASRKTALMYLVHFAGDAHQPLHVADNHDYGGNELPVQIPGTRAKSLHSLWDGLVMIREWQKSDLAPTPFDPKAMEDRMQQQLGPLMDKLKAGLSQADTSSWTQGDMASAAVLEGHSIAHDLIYPAYQKSGPKIDPAYEDQVQPIVFERLERAGVRLAALLDQAFGGPAVSVAAAPRVLDADAVNLGIEKAIGEASIH